MSEPKPTSTSSNYLLALDKKVKSITTRFWEYVLSIRIIPKKTGSDFDFLSDADRIEEEPINNNYPIILYVIVTLIAIGLTWAGLSSIDQVVSGTGRIVSVEQNIILQPQETAEIKDVLVKVGQSVKKGDILIVLDPTIPQADFLQAQGAYQGILRSLEISKKEITTIEARVRAAQDIENMTRQLVERNFQSKRALIETQEKKFELEQLLLSAKSRQNELLSQQNSYEQQLIKARRRNELIEIIAPRDGVILELSALTKGSVSKATETLVTLVPTDVPIIAEVLIDPSNISGLTSGSRAKVKLDPFPFQRWGYIEGTVDSVSPDAIQSRTQTGKSSYVVRIRFSTDPKYSELIGKVIPGMTLVAEVVSDQRSILEYIFDPLLKIKLESLNEK